MIDYQHDLNASAQPLVTPSVWRGPASCWLATCCESSRPAHQHAPDRHQLRRRPEDDFAEMMRCPQPTVALIRSRLPLSDRPGSR